MIYEKNKLNRVTLRLNDKQFAFVKENADLLGVSPSEFLRMVINVTMSTSKVAVQKIADSIDRKEGTGRENDITDKHDFV